MDYGPGSKRRSTDHMKRGREGVNPARLVLVLPGRIPVLTPPRANSIIRYLGLLQLIPQIICPISRIDYDHTALLPRRFPLPIVLRTPLV
jgi:hypothetical protein